MDIVAGSFIGMIIGVTVSVFLVRPLLWRLLRFIDRKRGDILPDYMYRTKFLFWR
ncbi:hypothetical protein LCGC14_2225580 [marine sediment metagenome]|uniref:Uncharacterized protein n=1 Tax=marine sediment metagenome TaxID=412755 RepID=A0A0F9D9T9_9ZZZZ